MKILVTGATGFVGRALVDGLLAKNHNVSTLVRSRSPILPTGAPQIVYGDISQLGINSELKNMNRASGLEAEEEKLKDTLKQSEVVVHLAARVHVMNEKAQNPLTEFRKINTDATLGLAMKAANAGVKRFIFLSTIKVNGELTKTGSSFSEHDICAPTDPYGISKWEAEQGLIQIAQETDMEVVIIRPPLIYGSGVKGNLASLMGWIGKGIPLPLGLVKNQRSLLALDNLVSFIAHCLTHPKAANEVFLLADGENVTTTQLIRKLARAMGKDAKLLPVPVPLMKFVAGLLGKKDIADRLFGSLQIDCSKARNLLDWQPPVSMDNELKHMVE